jgi:hypothetical protein
MPTFRRSSVREPGFSSFACGKSFEARKQEKLGAPASCPNILTSKSSVRSPGVRTSSRAIAMIGIDIGGLAKNMSRHGGLRGPSATT